MSQEDETAGTYLYYVHDISTTDNLTSIDKTMSELLPSGLEDMALN